MSPRVLLAGIVAVGAALRAYRLDALSLWLGEGITAYRNSSYVPSTRWIARRLRYDFACRRVE